MDPAADLGTPGPPPAGGKSALAFFGVLLALYPVGILAQLVGAVPGVTATQLFCFLLPALVMTAGSNLRLGPYLRLAPPRPAHLALGALAGAAASLLAAAVMTFTERLVPASWRGEDLSRLFEGPAWERAAMVAVAAGLAPVCEEITFRGYLQTTLALRRRPAAAIGAAALLFALLHLDPVRFPALALLGAAFGWMTWRARSIWPAVAAHAANNGLAAALFLSAGPRGEERPSAAATAGLLAFGGTALALLLRRFAAASPAPPPAVAADAISLRDPASPSIRFDPGRVPRPLAAVAAAGMAVLLALAVLGLAALARSG